MKKIAIIVTGLCMLLAAVAGATQTRVGSFSASGYVPDAEYDTLNINPAFVMKYAGLSIIDENAFQIYSQTYTRENYFSVGSNQISKEVTKYSSLYMSPQIGLLGKAGTFGLGFLLTPYYDSYKNVITTDSNILSTQDLETTTTSGAKSLLNATALFGMGLGDMNLAVKLAFASTPDNYLTSTKTNGTEDKTTIDKKEKTTTAFSGTLGVLKPIGDMDVGVAVKYGISTIVDKPSTFPGFGANYNNASNVFMGQFDVNGSSLGLSVIADKKTSEEKAMRVFLAFSRDASLQKVTLDKANVDKVNGTGFYDANLKGFKDEVDLSTISIPVKVSFITKKEALSDIGLGLVVGMNSSVNTHDDDTAVASPTTTGQKYNVKNTSTSFGLTGQYGIEGKVLEKFTLRGGLITTLFSLDSSTAVRTDKYDPIKLVVADYEVYNSSTSGISLLTSLQLNAGLGYQISEKLAVDVAAGANILGLNLNTFNQDNPNQQPKTTNVRTYKTTTIDFQLNCAVSYKL